KIVQAEGQPGHRHVQALMHRREHPPDVLPGQAAVVEVRAEVLVVVPVHEAVAHGWEEDGQRHRGRQHGQDQGRARPVTHRSIILSLTLAASGGYYADMSAGRVMIVDDELEVRLVLSEFLSGRGYDVMVAESGAQALALLTGEAPDVVLLDVTMPEMDGVETL